MPGSYQEGLVHGPFGNIIEQGFGRALRAPQFNFLTGGLSSLSIDVLLSAWGFAMRSNFLQLVFFAAGIVTGIAVLKPSLLFHFTSTQGIHFGGVRIALVPIMVAFFVLASWARGRVSKRRP